MITPERIDGWMESVELCELARLAKGAKVIIELGCYKGRSTKQLAASSEGIIFAIDNFIGVAVAGGQEPTIRQDFESHLQPEIESGRLVLLPISGDCAVKFLRAAGITADLIFIDAGHDYESVKVDIANYLPLVRKGGTICGHDYREFHAGLRQAVHEAFGDDLEEKPEGSTIWIHRCAG